MSPRSSPVLFSTLHFPFLLHQFIFIFKIHFNHIVQWQSLEVLWVCSWQLKTWFSPSSLWCGKRISDAPEVTLIAFWLRWIIQADVYLLNPLNKCALPEIVFLPMLLLTSVRGKRTAFLKQYRLLALLYKSWAECWGLYWSKASVGVNVFHLKKNFMFLGSKWELSPTY